MLKLSRFTKIVSCTALGSLVFYKGNYKKTFLQFPKVNCTSEHVESDLNNLELVHVQIFYRHGARTPLHLINCGDPNMVANWDPGFFLNKSLAASQFRVNHLDLDGGIIPNHPVRLEKYYQSKTLPGGSCIGQLTRHGQQQMFDLGLHLRKRYEDELSFISPKYKPEEIYCRSTRLYRNLESSKCLLAGLFNLEDPLNKDYPIMYSSKFEIETLVPNNHMCKVLTDLAEKGTVLLNKESDVSLTRDKLNQKLEVEEVKCILCNSVHKMYHYRDDLVSRDYHGFYLPQSVRDFLTELETIAVKEFLFQHFGGPLSENFSSIKFNAGNVIHIILENISSLKGNSTVEKFYLFATHDSMLMPLLVFFDIFDNKWPPYAADLRIEIYKDRSCGKYWCQMLYCGKPRLPGYCDADVKYSSGSCLFPLELFENYLKPYAVDMNSYKILCGYAEKSGKFTIDERPAGL